MKQCVHAMLHSVPATWNQSVSRARRGAEGYPPDVVGIRKPGTESNDSSSLQNEIGYEGRRDGRDQAARGGPRRRAALLAGAGRIGSVPVPRKIAGRQTRHTREASFRIRAGPSTRMRPSGPSTSATDATTATLRPRESNRPRRCRKTSRRRRPMERRRSGSAGRDRRETPPSGAGAITASAPEASPSKAAESAAGEGTTSPPVTTTSRASRPARRDVSSRRSPKEQPRCSIQRTSSTPVSARRQAGRSPGGAETANRTPTRRAVSSHSRAIAPKKSVAGPSGRRLSRASEPGARAKRTRRRGLTRPS